MLTPTSRFARAVISAMLIFGSAGPAGWTGAVGAEPACDATPGFGDVGDCAVWAAAPAMPSNRTATKARAISRNRSIIGFPPTGNYLNRRLTVDGVDNKANGRFCRLAGMGIAQTPVPVSGSDLAVGCHWLNPASRRVGQYALVMHLQIVEAGE